VGACGRDGEAERNSENLERLHGVLRRWAWLRFRAYCPDESASGKASVVWTLRDVCHCFAMFCARFSRYKVDRTNGSIFRTGGGGAKKRRRTRFHRIAIGLIIACTEPS
jgi:hypothetical protein